MMSKEKRRVPKLRFPGFTEDWEQRKLGDFYTFKNGLNKEKVYFGYGDSIVNFTDVFHNRQIYSSTLKGKVCVNKKELENYKVKEGDLFFTRTSETIDEIGFPAVVMEPMERVVFSGFVLRGRAEKYDPLVNIFKSYIFFTNNFRSEMKKKSSMTTRALTSGTALKEMYFSYPKDLEEQTKIGEILLRLDKIITLHQRKLDNLKLKKKALLQKLFPKNGERYPELRFPGFTDAWEQCKLSDLTQLITKGTTPKVKNIQNGVNFIKVENISDDGVISINSYVSEEEHMNFLSRSILSNNDILFSIAGTLGRTAIVKSHLLPANTNQALAIIRLNKSVDVVYINTFLKSNAIKTYIRKNPTVGAQPNLSLGQVSDLEINIPSYNEQKKISNLFSKFDLMITLHQRKLDHLQLQKKALLQQMFV